MAKQLDPTRNYFQCVRLNDAGQTVRIVCANGWYSDPTSPDPSGRASTPVSGDNSIPYDPTMTWTDIETALDAKLKANAGIP